MPDVKQKPSMIKPKTKSKNYAAVKEASVILKKQYLAEQEKRKPQQEESANVYATEQVETAASKGAELLLHGTYQSIKRSAQQNAEERNGAKYQQQNSFSDSTIEREYFDVSVTRTGNTNKQTKQHQYQVQQFQEQTARKVSEQKQVLYQNVTHLRQSGYATDYHEKTVDHNIDHASNKPKPIILNNAEKKNTQLLLSAENKVSSVQPVEKIKSNKTMLKSDFARTQRQAFFHGEKSPAADIAARRKTFVQRKMMQKFYTHRYQLEAKKQFTLWKGAKEFVSHAGKAISSTANTFLAAGSGLILLVSVMLIAMLSAVAASPFGILLSDESAEPGTISVSAAVAYVNQSFTEELEKLQNMDDYDAIEITGSAAQWPEVLAVFATKTTGNEEASAADVIRIDQNKLDILTSVFWDMTQISHEVITKTVIVDDEKTVEKILKIKITSKSPYEMAVKYQYSKRQIKALQELLAQRSLLSGLIGSVGAMSADAKEILDRLPDDFSPERKAVVREALSLVGKVNYFWGGKSLTLGWNSAWGELKKVTASGSPTTGTYRLYGLDCSGFVDWAFFNVSGGDYVIGQGGGVKSQRANCEAITFNEAQAGDLVFYDDNSHIGIVCGRDDAGNLQIVHCSSGANNVVITGASGFSAAGRSVYFDD